MQCLASGKEEIILTLNVHFLNDILTIFQLYFKYVYIGHYHDS